MSAAGLALQRALYGALASDAALMAEIRGVYDHVPAGAAMPYATIGPDVTTDAGSKTGAGREHRVAVSVWDDGRSAARVKAILALVEGAVAGLAGDIGGWRLVQLRFLRSFVAPAPAGATQGVVEFRARTEMG